MQGHDVPLASWGARFGAVVLDGILVAVSSAVALLVSVIGGGTLILSLLLPVFFDSSGGTAAIGAFGIVMLALGAALGLSYWVWWLFTLRNGQTPGKLIVGIRAMNVATEETVSWGRMFLREFVVKSFPQWVIVLASVFAGDNPVVPLLSVALAILWVVNYLWPLWDRKNQALHDKVVGTIIVRERASQYDPVTTLLA